MSIQEVLRMSRIGGDYQFNKGKYLGLVGYVQSGKTMEEIIYSWRSIYVEKLPIIFLVRNITADQLQLHSRIKEFNNKLSKKIKYSPCSDPEEKIVETLQNGHMITALSNFNQMKKLGGILEKHAVKYNMCIDEADFCVKSKDMSSQLEKYLNIIKENATHILGATATPFAIFSSEKNLGNVKQLPPSANYKGIKSLNLNYVTPVIIKKEFPECDRKATNKIYSSFIKKDFGIILHTVIKVKECHEKLKNYLLTNFPQLTVIIYNGDGISVQSPARESLVALAEKLKIQDTGLRKKYWMMRRNADNSKITHLFENYGISEVLQCLKQDSAFVHNHICIIAGNLAARGISFVSSDYQWHLTDQYIHPARSTHGENILQSLRLLGCYNDSTPLNLWCSKKTWEDIQSQYSTLYKLVEGCFGAADIFYKIQQVKVMRTNRPLSRPKIMKATSWDCHENYFNINIEYQQFEENSSEDENNNDD